MTESKLCFNDYYAVKALNTCSEFTTIVPGGDFPSSCLHMDKLANQASELIKQLGRRSHVSVRTKHTQSLS